MSTYLLGSSLDSDTPNYSVKDFRGPVVDAAWSPQQKDPYDYIGGPLKGGPFLGPLKGGPFLGSFRGRSFFGVL